MAKAPGFVPCTGCLGSGAKDVTEIYYDKDGKLQTRTVRVMCGDCGGSGGYHV